MKARYWVGAMLLAASQAAADTAAVRFFDLSVDPDIAQGSLGRAAYVVRYTVENISTSTVRNLGVVVIGRNEQGRVVETQEAPVVWRGSLPDGLAPSDSIVMRHGLLVSNPEETVTTIEVQIQDIRLAE